MFNYHVTAHKPTVVTHAVVGNFTSPTEVNLIVCKGTRLEIHKITSDGLAPFLEVGVYGRIAAVELFRPKNEKQDFLFVSTEQFKFCVLSYDNKRNEILTRANGDIEDKSGRPADIGQLAAIDPECRMIGLYLYEGMLKTIPVDPRGQLQEAFNVRLEETNIIDFQFLHGTNKPTCVVLYQDPKEGRHVKTYEVGLKEKELQEGPWSLPNVEGGACKLITLPKPLGGTIIIGEQSIVYHNGTAFKSLAMKTTVIKAYGKIDASGARILLGDHTGKLYVLVLQNDGSSLPDMKLELIAETSCASVIRYLDNGVVFIGSTFGDSQLVRLKAEKDPETGQYVELLESYTNLGPIVDFVVVDTEKQGQGQVITCSGAYKDGSLRLIRNGIGLNEHAVIELPGIKGVWSLSTPPNSRHEKFLVVTFVGETRVLGMAGEELEEIQLNGFAHDQQTLYCGNLASGAFVQVTNSGVFLISAAEEKLLNSWQPKSGNITTCSANSVQLALAIGGNNLTILEIDGNTVKQTASKAVEHEIACLSIRPIGVNSPKANLVAVGLWTDISVRLLRLPNLEEMAKEVIGGEIIPRSVLFSTFEGVHYLLVAMGDGNLYNFVLDLTTCALSNKKKVALGTHPITLSPFVSKDQTNVFSCSDRPTVIYSNNKKLLYSTVNLKDVTFVAEFNSASFPDSLALATEGNLTIGTIDEIQKLHIKTIGLGEMPRRIAYQEPTKSLCVLTAKFEVDDSGEEVETNHVRLLDSQTFELLDGAKLEHFENVSSVLSASFQEGKEHYFIVGTAYALPNELEPTKGRIIVYRVNERKLQVVTELETKGAVYSLEAMSGKLLAGINSKVHLYKWAESAADGFELKQECEHGGHILALYLAAKGDFIVVGDLMKSISLLVYKPVDGRIEELARDYNPNWMTAVEILTDDTFIGAENSFNLFTVRKNSEATTDEERLRLEQAGCFHLGEFVNRFRHGSLVMKLPDTEASNVRTMLYGSVNGALGVIGTINQEQHQFFSALQEAITRVIKGVGGFSHSEWRSFHNERKVVPATNFIDGDLIESFLDLPREKQDQISQSIAGGVSTEEIIKRIESMSAALH